MTKGSWPKKHRRKKKLINKQKQYYSDYQKQAHRKTKISDVIFNSPEHKISEEETIKSYLEALEESISLYKKYKEIITPQIIRQSSELEKRFYTSTLSKEKLEEFEKTYRGICSKLVDSVNSYKELEDLEKI